MEMLETGIFCLTQNYFVISVNSDGVICGLVFCFGNVTFEYFCNKPLVSVEPLINYFTFCFVLGSKSPERNPCNIQKVLVQ